MRRKGLEGLERLLAGKRDLRFWKRAVAGMACVVVFCTTYALILPALTLEDTGCGLEEHVHSLACYTQVASVPHGEPGCSVNNLGLHTHTDGCYGGQGELVCGYADFAAHVHNAGCYDESGDLWCPLPEIRPHTHGESCFSAARAHSHTDACYTERRGALLCTVEAGEGHTHDSSCFTETSTLICGTPEEEDGHRHDAACFETATELVCPLSEGAGHQHTDSCYAWEKVLTCGQEEGPAEAALICGQEEVILHTHTPDCFDETGTPVCGKLQVLEHVHTADCAPAATELVDAGTLTCPLPEDEDHTHTDLCYGTWELTCGLEEHTHTPACPVIGLIGALPSRTEIEEKMASFADGKDGDAYLTGLRAKVREAHQAYAALTADQQAAVSNADRLMELEWLWSAEPLDDVVPSIVYNYEAGGQEEGSTELSTIDESIKERLTSWLSSKGYQSVDMRVYKSGPQDNAAWKSAEVLYPTGLVGADNHNNKLYVLDLGPEGTDAPVECTITNSRLFDNKYYSYFTFEPAEREGTSDNAPRVYAFISANPLSMEEMEIYPGEQVAENTWVAYDAPCDDPTDATVKATVTLPDGVTAPEGYRLFIHRVNEGEPYYPTEEAVKEAAATFNGYQCWMIRWVKVDDQGVCDATDMKTMSEVLGHGGDEKKSAAVNLAYQKADAKLPGPSGARKLLVFNSAEDGSLLGTVSDTVTDVDVTSKAYNSFTFQTDQAGPYVFVSKTVEQGYVAQLIVEKTVDGSAPFDSSDEPGNDSSDQNGIVRSYDTIQYKLKATFGARDNTTTKQQVKVFFEMSLYKSVTAARFDTSQMLELAEHYVIEYLTADGEVVMVQARDGKFYQPLRNEAGNILRDENGFTQVDESKEVKLNGLVSGSKGGEDSYKVATGGIVQQRFTGWKIATANENENILNSNRDYTAAITVRNADQGEVFQPTFKVWLEGNENNYGSESTNESGMVPAQPVDNHVTAKPITVSAGTNFNLQLKKNQDMSYKDWFDFSTGNAVEPATRAELVRLANLQENHGKSNPAQFTEDGVALSAEKQAQYAHYRYGRITCYGITLQLYNDTDNKPEENRAAKGLKGFSLPVGDITFDLNFASRVTSGGSSFEGSGTEYTAILWDYNENVPAHNSYHSTFEDPSYKDADGNPVPARGYVKTEGNGRGNGGRTLYWDHEVRSDYAKGGGPSNFRTYHGGCYYGGDWAMVNDDGTKLTSLEELNRVANPTVVKGTGGNTTYHFSVSDYDFDFDDHFFPSQDAGNTGAVSIYTTYAKCFSAGCVQVLSVFPMVSKQPVVDNELVATVSNLHLETRAGQELTAKANDSSKIQHEVNPNDNQKKDKIDLYKPGNLTKGSSFNGKWGSGQSKPPENTSQGYLGTEYWSTSYDCSTFAGDDIWLIGYGMMSSGSDYRTRSMNLLQLFDSRALRIRRNEDVKAFRDAGAGDVKGTENFLYAGDPDHPEGYDTNEPGVLEYMNGVREEDLVYTASPPDENGYIHVNGKELKCIGVLMEVRECSLLGGMYQYLRIPVKVTGDEKDLVGKTVATVNTVRVWSKDLGDITWAKGHWNEAMGKNVLENYPRPTNSIDTETDVYSGELCNTGGSNYVKTEYENGLQVEGTHAGGTLAGNSLLLLSYKAGVHITVDNKGDPESGSLTYNQGDGETVVDYRLKNIETEVSDPTSQENPPRTKLTLNAVLDEGYKGEQRLSVSGNTYYMDKCYEVGADGEPTGEETRVAISGDSNNPTQIAFRDSYDHIHVLRVHAELGPNNQSVKFIIQDAPVGIHLPDIIFQANFSSVSALKENATMKTSVSISGEGDNRAYDAAKGNLDNITVGVVLGSGTNLTKEVDHRYIEQNGTITYDVIYTNSGTETIDTMYFYDLLPNPEDVRGSQFKGEVGLRDVKVTTSGGNPGVDPVKAEVYYSTVPYGPLFGMVRTFGGQVTNNTVSGMNAEKVEELINGEVKYETEEGNLVSYLQKLGTVENNQIKFDAKLPAGKEELAELMDSVTGLYVKAQDLKQNQSITLSFTIATEENKASDDYKNFATCWIAGSDGLPLTSNMVETSVISRRISGVVWHDKNLDGLRGKANDGSNEPLLSGVTVTLFQKDSQGTYQLCEKDVTGSPINEVVTGTDGAYAFEKLAEGDYIVAFSGNVLKKFTGAAAYQTGGPSAVSNDGVAISELEDSGIDADKYAYAIRYTAGSPDIHLHSLKEIINVSLNNYVEDVDHQDLGVVITGPELPMTGGPGAGAYTLGGLVLLAGAALWGLARRKKERLCACARRVQR